MKINKLKLSEEQLIEAIRVKSRIGAEVMYDMYSGSLFGVIFKIVNNNETAEDLLQQVFIKIWDSFEGYDASKGRLFTWMITIARNAARDVLRSSYHRHAFKTGDIELHAQEIDKSFHVIFNNDIIFIKNLVTNLKSDQKDIINLIYFKGYTQSEASEELGIPLGTVKTRCRAGISVLRSFFYHQGYGLRLVS